MEEAFVNIVVTKNTHLSLWISFVGNLEHDKKFGGKMKINTSVRTKFSVN
jgi:hypothetical protein